MRRAHHHLFLVALLTSAVLALVFCGRPRERSVATGPSDRASTATPPGVRVYRGALVVCGMIREFKPCSGGPALWLDGGLYEPELTYHSLKLAPCANVYAELEGAPREFRTALRGPRPSLEEEQARAAAPWYPLSPPSDAIASFNHNTLRPYRLDPSVSLSDCAFRQSHVDRVRSLLERDMPTITREVEAERFGHASATECVALSPVDWSIKSVTPSGASVLIHVDGRCTNDSGEQFEHWVERMAFISVVE